MILDTTEIRWFSSEPFPSIEAWLKSNIPILEPHKRTDKYLISAMKKGIGIKLREDRIEIKYRVTEASEIQLLSRISGNIETYRKLSFKVDESPDEIRKLLSDESEWLPVIKERYLIFLKRSSNKSGIKSSLNYLPEETECQLEYTKVSVRDKAYFTLGIEWFGENYFLFTKIFLEPLFHGIVLKNKNSMGYVDFLNGIGH